MGADMFQFLFEGIFLATKQAAVYLDLLFTFTTLLHAAFLARKVRPLAGEARQIVLNLGQFDLQTALSGMGALAEDDEDEGRAVEYLHFQLSFQCAMVSRG